MCKAGFVLLVMTMLSALLRSLSALACARPVLPVTSAPRAVAFPVGTGMCKAGFAGDDGAPRAVAFPVGTGMCKAGFAGDDDAPHAVAFPVGTGMCKAGFAGDDDALRAVACSSTCMWATFPLSCSNRADVDLLQKKGTELE